MVWWLWLLVVVAVVVAVGVALGFVAVRRQRARTAALRERFGPEYDRAVEAAGGSRAGEAELEERLERRRGLSVSAVNGAERPKYEEEWSELEDHFEGEDSELAALARADALVTTILADCGYPLESFDRRAADLSVDYPEEVGHYRRAHDVYRRADDGEASREDMYEALQHYRAFLDALLGSQRADTGDGRPQRPPTPIEEPVEARR